MVGFIDTCHAHRHHNSITIPSMDATLSFSHYSFCYGLYIIHTNMDGRSLGARNGRNLRGMRNIFSAKASFLFPRHVDSETDDDDEPSRGSSGGDGHLPCGHLLPSRLAFFVRQSVRGSLLRLRCDRESWLCDHRT